MSVADRNIPLAYSAVERHAVQFYETDEFLCEVIARYTVESLALGHRVLLLATREHAADILSRVDAAGVDGAAAVAAEELVIRDARATLHLFMSGPLLDESRCYEVLQGLLEALVRGGLPGGSVRAFGEMVDVLWREGHTVAALRLEEIWNELGTRYPLTLICGYSMGNFTQTEHHRAFARVCDHHVHVLPPEGYAGLAADDQVREVNRLRQRARALQLEVERRTELEHALRDALAARRRSEEELRVAKEAAERASRAKSDFLAIMSHELRTPLNAVFGYEDLLRHHVGGTLTEQQHHYLERLRASADQLLGLVNQVLQLSRIEAGHEEVAAEVVSPAALGAAALESIEPCAAKKGLELRLDDQTNGFELRTDGGKLRQILLNLLSNAVKFTETGSVSVTVRRRDGELLLQVADTGIGIDPEHVVRIFEPFIQADATTTRRYGGTGLGLAVSRHLAELLGGSLTVASTPDRGSTFTLTLPAA